MPKVCVELSDIEYKILTELKTVEGNDSERLKNLFRYHLSTIPQLKSADYALKRVENKEEIEEILKDVLSAYKNTEYPTESWGDEKINKLSVLTELDVLSKTDGKGFIPTSKFRDLFKMLLYDIATENKDMDEHKAALVAVIQLLREFGAGTLSKETIRDGVIFLNERWLFVYAAAMKEAREFMKTKKLSLSDKTAGTS